MKKSVAPKGFKKPRGKRISLFHKPIPAWVDIRVPLTYPQMREYFGRKCRTYFKGCGCCDGWKEWEKDGWVRCDVETGMLVNALLKGVV